MSFGGAPLGRVFYSTDVGEGNDIVVSPDDVPSLLGSGRALLTFTGSNTGTNRVVLPNPGTDALAYEINVENLSGAPLDFAYSPSSAPGPENTIALSQRQNTEQTFRQAVQTISGGGIALDYRTALIVDSDGVGRIPAYSTNV